MSIPIDQMLRDKGVGGISVIENNWLPDDQMFLTSDPAQTGGAWAVIVVGTRPPDPIKQAGRAARLLVRRGLADVLEWLGEDVVNEPLMARIKALAASGKGGLPPWFRADWMPKETTR
jgi:hypothetical protein